MSPETVVPGCSSGFDLEKSRPRYFDAGEKLGHDAGMIIFKGFLYSPVRNHRRGYGQGPKVHATLHSSH